MIDEAAADRRKQVDETGLWPTVTVVVPVFNAMAYLPRTIPAIQAAIERYGRAALVMVDNGSTDGSLRYMEQLAGEVTVLRRPEGTISALRNAGVEEGTGEVIAFIDADCLVDEDHLVVSVATLRDTGAAATGSPYALPENPHWVEEVWSAMHRAGADGWVRHLNAGNLVCRRSAFREVGGFDENLTTGEDAELCLRMVRAGHRIYSSSAIVAQHLGNPKSSGAFFRKQVWHSLGMLGTMRISVLDRPLLMTIVFIAAVAGAVLVPFFVGGWTGVALMFLLVVSVPLAAVVHRAVTNRTRPRLIRGTYLYGLYFAARCWGLVLLLSNRDVEASAEASQRLRG